MHIALDVRATDAHFPGVGREILGLLGGLHALPDAFEVDLIGNPQRPLPADRAVIAGDVRFRWHTVAAGPLSLAQQWEVPRRAHRLGHDVWHAPYYLRPLWGVGPCVIKVADLIPERVPQASSWRARLLFRLIVRLSLHGARQVISGSQAAARDLEVLHRVPPNRLHVIPLAADQRFVPQSAASIADVRARYGLPQRYLLYLGSNKPHKQPEVAVEAFIQAVRRGPALADVHLVVAGRLDPRLLAAQRAAAALPNRILFRPNVADADLPALLAGAAAFVFPSLYEGFGLPPLEAMACGTPVIVSNRTSLPEVVGDAGLLIEPTAGAFADAIQQLLHDPQLHADLRERGLRQAARFSWERTAAATLHVLQLAATPAH